jgi:hypothetical protein
MKIIAIFLLWAQLAQAGMPGMPETLQFAANVQNEDLAEEAVHLLHCLSERSGAPWEFTGEISGDHWLRVNEKEKSVHASYRHEGMQTEFDLPLGGAESACEKIFPDRAISEKAPEPVNLGNLSVPTRSERKTAYRAWAAAFAGAGVLGFLIWKSRQPDHRALVMN